MRLQVAVVLLLLLGVPAQAGDPEHHTVRVEQEAHAGSEKVTRQSILPPENLSVEGLDIEVRADGILKADLRGRFVHAIAVRIEPDGSSRIECLDDAGALTRFLSPSREESSRKQETAEK